MVWYVEIIYYAHNNYSFFWINIFHKKMVLLIAQMCKKIMFLYHYIWYIKIRKLTFVVTMFINPFLTFE
jgi:hypothetical protein